MRFPASLILYVTALALLACKKPKSLRDVDTSASHVKALLTVGTTQAVFRRDLQNFAFLLEQARRDRVKSSELAPYEKAFKDYQRSLDIWNDKSSNPYYYDWPGQYPLHLAQVAEEAGIESPELRGCLSTPFTPTQCNGVKYLQAYQGIIKELWQRADRSLAGAKR